MKTYLLSIFALLIVGCGNQRQQQAIFADKLDSVKRAYITALDSMRLEYANTTDSLIHIRYTNLIDGYRVNVMWQPEYCLYGKIVGKAIINFRGQKRHFSMVHSHYFLNNENRDVPDSVAIQSFDKSHIYEIEYPAQSRREDVPFFFEDNSATLVLTMWGAGRKNCNTYRYHNVIYSQDDLYQGVFQDPPYTKIDDFTRFDEGKIILLTVFRQKEEIYEKNDSTESYELTYIKERPTFFSDSVFTYKVEKRLVKKEYCENKYYSLQ